MGYDLLDKEITIFNFFSSTIQSHCNLAFFHMKIRRYNGIQLHVFHQYYIIFNNPILNATQTSHGYDL